MRRSAAFAARPPRCEMTSAFGRSLSTCTSVGAESRAVPPAGRVATDHAGRDRRGNNDHMHRHRYPGGDHHRAEQRTADRAEAEAGVEPCITDRPEMPLDSSAVDVHRHVPRAGPDPHHAEADHHRARRRSGSRCRDSRHPEARTRPPSLRTTPPRRPACADEGTGERQGDRAIRPLPRGGRTRVRTDRVPTGRAPAGCVTPSSRTRSR